MEYYLVVDNGGTNIKSVLIDLQGDYIASSSFPTPRQEPYENHREVNMDVMWESIACSIRTLITDNDIAPDDIIGVTTVGHGKGLYLLGEGGSIIRNGILSTDNRAYAEAEYFKNKNTDMNLQPILAASAPVLLYWIKIHEPEVYSQISSFISAKDYVRYCLTGKIYTDYTDGSSNNMLDLYTKKYNSEIFSFFEIKEMYSKKPKLISSTDVCGYVTEEAASQTGLKAGTPVSGGMFDIDASAIATRVLNEDYISVTAGTWGINEYLTKEPVKPSKHIMNSIFVDDRYYLVESSSATSAGNLDMILRLLLQLDNEKIPDEIYTNAERILLENSMNNEDLIFVPFLYGSYMHPLAKSSFVGLDSSTSFSDLIVSVYEGVVFAHRFHLEELLKTKTSKTKAIRLAGGVINSPAWIQLFADVLQVNVEVVDGKELGALGGAIALSVALGKYDNLNEASENMSNVKEIYKPNLRKKDFYDKKYKRYLSVVNSLDDSWD